MRRSNTRPLLSYPGSKSRAAEYIADLIQKGAAGRRVVSPFFGGGAAELACIRRGMTVAGFDAWADVVNFWRQVLKAPDVVSGYVQMELPVEKLRWHWLRLRLLESICEECPERAAQFYVVTKLCFNGSIFGGFKTKRENILSKSLAMRIYHFRAPRLSVQMADFKDVISGHPDDFLYCDPPYFNKWKLYECGRNCDFDHAGLAALLMKRDNWILSYNNCPEARELYAGCTITEAHWHWPSCKPSSRTDKNSGTSPNEILITRR